MSNFGKCDCGGNVVPVYFMEPEYKPNSNTKTGRVRKACSHLICDTCMSQTIVDDSFDGPWVEV